MIVVSHLSKVYGTFKAVDDLSFAVGAGEVVGLIGPNGAGKTSTLRCLVGIQAPSAGSIAIDGHNIVTDPVAAKQQVAFMADEPNLFEYLTVMEHLRLIGRIYGSGDVDNKARTLIQELQLTGKEKSLPSELSRGMKQKVAIACGLLHDPKALLFDEPLTGLDPLGIRQMKETIVRRGRAGAAVIVSSHLDDPTQVQAARFEQAHLFFVQVLLGLGDEPFERRAPGDRAEFISKGNDRWLEKCRFASS